MSEKSFLSSCTSGGCGAKIGPGELAGILSNLPAFSDPRLTVGFDSSDDAAVYRLNDQTSLISTADFFSPMVEDAKSFGRIAATNAMSDVWAMGGTPILALNIVCFPEALDKSLLGDMLAGGAEKIKEAGAILGGGHSIYDKEPKYGLAVTGLVDNDKVIRNDTLRVGDKMILTKALGVGIIMAAARADAASIEAEAKAVASMERLNRYAAEKMAGYEVSACTDVTGFGLLAHMAEMAAGRVTIKIYAEALPTIPEAVAYANDFLLTAAGQRNRNHLGKRIMVNNLPFSTQEMLFDPQTSGGLLIAVSPRQADALLTAIQKDDPVAAIVGEVLPKDSMETIFA